MGGLQDLCPGLTRAADNVNVLLVSPKPRRSRTGNDVTSRRWARHLEGLGHRAAIRNRYPPRDADGEPPPFGGDPPDLLVALHARRSAGSVRRWRDRRERAPLVVALTGTDLYRDLETSEEARASVAAADRLVVLQPKGLERIPAGHRDRGRVIHQSAEPPGDVPPPREEVFEVSQLCHMRPVKDPFRAAAAVRRLPADSRVELVHAGKALTEEAGERARREAEENPRYRWLGELDRGRALRLLARSRVMVLTSRLEGGANVVTEALACGTPVISSEIEGSVGLLGDDYPGYFPVGETGALADLLHRAESDPALLEDLRASCRARARLADPAREREAWRELLEELAGDGRGP